jgi:hypothetical protein
MGTVLNSDIIAGVVSQQEEHSNANKITSMHVGFLFFLWGGGSNDKICHIK